MKKNPYYVECEKYALKMKDITGDNYKDTDLRVCERRTANPGTVFTALRKGGIVIPIVNASLLGEYNVEVTATVVVKANRLRTWLIYMCLNQMISRPFPSQPL